MCVCVFWMMICESKWLRWVKKGQERGKGEREDRNEDVGLGFQDFEK